MLWSIVSAKPALHRYGMMPNETLVLEEQKSLFEQMCTSFSLYSLCNGKRRAMSKTNNELKGIST